MAKTKLIIFGDPKRPHAAEAVEEFVGFVSDKADILANCLDVSCSLEGGYGRVDTAPGPVRRGSPDPAGTTRGGTVRRTCHNGLP